MVRREAVLEELRRRLDGKRQRRCVAAEMTVAEWAEMNGSNVYEPYAGRYPWHDLQRRIAAYLETEHTSVAQPIYPVCVSRAHLKTEIGCNWASKFCVENPETRSAIIGATADRAERNLANISAIFEGDWCQQHFGGLLPKTGHASYTQRHVTLKRQGKYREHTIEAFGRNARMAGKHYNGFIWIDDIVTEQDNFENGEVSENVLRLLSHIIELIADPGCRIVLTFTRYHAADPYATILNPESDFARMTVPGAINLDCFTYDEDGNREDALYPFKFCMGEEDECSDVEYQGVVYKDVRRKSLLRMEERMADFPEQMLNRPRVGSGFGFDGSWFDLVLPVHGMQFFDWYEDKRNRDEYKLGNGALVVHILGDPSFRSGRANDYAVLLAVAQTPANKYVVLDAFHKKMGYQGDKLYAREALRMKELYNARSLAVEMHTRESLETVFNDVAASEGKRLQLTPLKDNTYIRKKDRIATLIPIAGEGRFLFCENVEPVRKILRGQAETFPHCCDGSGLHDDALDALSNTTQVFRARNQIADNPASADLAKWRSRLPRRIQRYLR